MDWTKAKTILIAALIITNVILGVSVIIQHGENRRIDSDVIDETLSFLESRNIFVYSNIPEKLKKMPVLQIEYNNFPVEGINERADQEDTLYKKKLNKEQAIQLTRDFLESNNLMNENIQMENIQEEANGYSVIYKNYYHDILLEECYINFTIREGRIIFIDRLWFNPIDYGENKKVTIPATTALLKFASLKENINEEISITSLELVYWVEDNSLFSMENTTSDTALPAWMITFNNGEKKYISAYEN